MIPRKLSLLLPPSNFMTFHYLYFIVTILLFSVIFWLSSRPEQSINYVDCLFMVTSAMTETGLNTVNLSQLNLVQQVLLFLLMIGGSSIFVSYFVVLVRKRAFESRFHELVEEYKKNRRDGTHDIRNAIDEVIHPSAHSQEQNRASIASPESSTQSSSSIPRLHNPRHGNERRDSTKDKLSVGRIKQPSSPDRVSAGRLEGAVTLQLRALNGTSEARPLGGSNLRHDEDSLGVFLTNGRPPALKEVVTTFLLSPRTSEDNIRNSRHELELYDPNASPKRDGIGRRATLALNDHTATVSLPSIGTFLSRTASNSDSRITREDRIHLGGVEYGAIKLLTYLIPAYFITCQLIGSLSSALYIASRCRDVANSNAANPWWLGIFLGVSAFNNCGLSLLDSGMTPFGTDTYLLATLSVLITAGNVAYPIILRSFLWLLRYIAPKSQGHQSWNERLQFILEYPRRVYTHVFPAAHTWWLLFALIVLTGVDWLSFDVLNLTNPAVVSIPFSFRQTVAFFQSISIRSAGFSVVPIGVLAVGTQVISVVMMYISAYPVLIPLRASNVYEERSLGIYNGDLTRQKTQKEAEHGSNARMRRRGIETKLFFLRQQLQHQLAHDIWWLTISIILVVCFEADNYGRDPVTFSVFNMIFEVVSAYGPVGLSMGLPNQAYSLSGGFHTISKVLMCAVMIRGRHRGLPVAIDKAVLLPSEVSHREERVAHIAA